MTPPSLFREERIETLLKEAEELLSGITPGEWRADDKDACICGDDGCVVCFGHDYDDYGGIDARTALMGSEGGEQYTPEWYAPYEREKAANRQFIAAAPRLLRDLLAALRSSVPQECECGCDGGELCCRPRPSPAPPVEKD